MDSWQSWVSIGVSAVVAMLVRSSFAEKQKRDTLDLQHSAKISVLEKELAILQKTALSDKEVRAIIREEIHPMSDRIEKMNNNLDEIAKSLIDLKLAVVKDVYRANNKENYE